MTKKSSLSFALSLEEVLVLLFHFKRSEMVGVDASVLSPLSKKEKDIALAVAERALLARGFLYEGADHTIKMTEPVLALVGTCLEPDKSLIIKFNQTNNLEQIIYFHTARKMRIMHSLPMTGIHQFIAVEDDQAMLKAILSVAQLGDISRVRCKKGSLEIDQLNLGKNIALEKGVDAANVFFTKQGLADNTARMLARSLVSLISNITVSFIDSVEDRADGFTLLRGENALWQIVPNEDDERVSIRSLSSSDAVKRLRSMLIPASN